MGLKSWLQDWWEQVDKKIHENRPIEPIIHVTEDEFEKIARANKVIGPSIRLLSSQSLLGGTPVKIGGKRYQVIQNH